MSDTVGDLSGNNVGGDTVRITYGSSTIEGVIEQLVFDTDHEKTLDGTKYYIVTAHMSVGGIYLENVPLSAPCSLVTRSDPK